MSFLCASNMDLTMPAVLQPVRLLTMPHVLVPAQAMGLKAAHMCWSSCSTYAAVRCARKSLKVWPL